MKLCDWRAGRRNRWLPIRNHAVTVLIKYLRNSCSSSYVGPGRLGIKMRPFSVDPFTYIGRTVSEFCPVGFTEGKEIHGFAINEKHFLEINRHFAHFSV